MAREPEIVREESPVRVEGLRTLVRLLDDAFVIPGTNFRFGLEAVIGLIPGAGDLAGGLMSSAVILTAAKAGAPKSIIARMLANAIIDTVVGAVPLLGDLFDAGWKANRRNLNLLEAYLDRPHATQKGSTLFVAGAILMLLLAVAGSVLLAVLLMRWLLNWGASF